MTALTINLTAYDQPEEDIVLAFMDKPIDLSRHLTPLETARPGDLFGVISRCLGREERPPCHELGPKAFCVLTEGGPRMMEFEQLPDEIAERVTQALGRGCVLNQPVFPIDLETHGAQSGDDVWVMHFADAVLSVGSDWVHAGLGRDSEPTTPEIRMQAASDLEAASELRQKILRYIDVFRKLLLSRGFNHARWDLRTPDLACLLDPEARSRFGCEINVDPFDD